MSDPNPSPEPSMEEIIASISRAIAADEGGHEPALPAAAKDDDILELTEALDEDGRVHRIEPAGPAAAPPPEAPGPIEPKLPGPEPRAGAATAGSGRERLISAATSKAAAMALARLGGRAPEHPTGSEPTVGGAGRTLDDIVREALYPLLRSWLDEHLPAIVERLVREEIGRVSGDAGLR